MTGCRYDPTIARGYDRRYRRSSLAGVAEALNEIAAATAAERGLEIGCGTGHWLGQVSGLRTVFGADISLSMLAKARAKGVSRILAAAAEALPFSEASFDFLWVVNAVHHFPDPKGFIFRVASLLMPGGALAVVGLDPAAKSDHWYIYDYFPTTRPTDLQRYPAHQSVRSWMTEAGLEAVTTDRSIRIQGRHVGVEIFEAPILSRYGTSQLCLLSDKEFAAGMERLRAAVDAAQAAGAEIVFPTDLVLPLTRATRPS